MTDMKDLKFERFSDGACYLRVKYLAGNKFHITRWPLNPSPEDYKAFSVWVLTVMQ